MTTRREIIIALAAAAITPPLTAFGQQPPVKIARVGWLSYLSAPDPGLALLREGLEGLGYVEGKSYVIVARFANDDFNQLPRLVEELAAERVDVIVSRGPSAFFTKSVRSRIPVVFAFSGDPIEAGFADSLSAPGRNMTGITFMAMELSAKRVEVLKELIPKASRIALLSNPEHAGELSEYRVTDETARRLGAAITRYLVRNPEALAAAFDAIRADKPDAMIVFPDALTFARRKDITDFAARAGIPCIYGWTEYADAGGLVSYGPTSTSSFKTLAEFVDKVLKGAAASKIPIEQEKRIGLTLNLAAARALRLNVPQAILVRADKVIQ
jgi:putative tryptophan/tyrosine transport system substrate-binding protein